MEEDLYDTIIYSCDGKPFKANSKIVCAYSKVLSKHFDGEHMNIIETIGHGKLKIKGVSSHVLQITLDFIYGVNPKTINNVKLLLIGATKLGVNNAIEFCKNQISDLCEYYNPSPVSKLQAKNNINMIPRNNDFHTPCYESIEKLQSIDSVFFKPKELNVTNNLVNHPNQNDTDSNYKQYESHLPHNIEYYQETDSYHSTSNNYENNYDHIDTVSEAVYSFGEAYNPNQKIHATDDINNHSCGISHSDESSHIENNQTKVVTQNLQNFEQIRNPPSYSSHKNRKLLCHDIIGEAVQIDTDETCPHDITGAGKTPNILNIGSLLECLETDSNNLLHLGQLASAGSSPSSTSVNYQSSFIENNNTDTIQEIYSQNSNQQWEYPLDNGNIKALFSSRSSYESDTANSSEISQAVAAEMYNNSRICAEKKSYYSASMHTGGECYILDQSNLHSNICSEFSNTGNSNICPVGYDNYHIKFTNGTKMHDYTELQSIHSHGYSCVDINGNENIYDSSLDTRLKQSFSDKLQLEYNIPLEKNMEIIEHNGRGHHETFDSSVALNSTYVNEICADIMANEFDKTESFAVEKTFDLQPPNSIITHYNDTPLTPISASANESFDHRTVGYYTYEHSSGSQTRSSSSTRKRQKLNATKQSKCTGPHVCKECNEVCLTVQALKRHQLKIHRKGQLFPCKKCTFKTPRKKDILSHLLSQHGLVPPNTKIFSCHHCSYRCVDKYRFYEHQATHSGIKSFRCDLCFNSFTTKRGLRNHVLRHSDNRPFQCERCQASFKVKSKLKDHTRLVHVQKGEKPFKCGYCDFHASVRGNVNQHIRNVHKQELIKVIDTKSHQRRFVKKYDYENITGNGIETKEAF